MAKNQNKSIYTIYKHTQTKQQQQQQWVHIAKNGHKSNGCLSNSNANPDSQTNTHTHARERHIHTIELIFQNVLYVTSEIIFFPFILRRDICAYNGAIFEKRIEQQQKKWAS